VSEPQPAGEQPTRWSRASQDTYRLKTLRTSLAVCLIAQRFGTWFSVFEAATEYRVDVGEISDRTIRRYLVALTQVGLLQEQRHDARDYSYRWRGWPAGGLLQPEESSHE